MRPERVSTDAVTEAFREALSDLGPADLRVLHMAMTRAAGLEAEGRGIDAEILLLGLLRILEADGAAPAATPEGLHS